MLPPSGRSPSIRPPSGIAFYLIKETRSFLLHTPAPEERTAPNKQTALPPPPETLLPAYLSRYD